MSDGNVISLARARLRLANGRATGVPPLPRPRSNKGGAIVLQVTGADVTLIADDVELDLTPAQAREIAGELLELADDAESRRG